MRSCSDLKTEIRGSEDGAVRGTRELAPQRLPASPSRAASDPGPLSLPLSRQMLSRGRIANAQVRLAWLFSGDA